MLLWKSIKVGELVKFSYFLRMKNLQRKQEKRDILKQFILEDKVAILRYMIKIQDK